MPRIVRLAGTCSARDLPYLQRVEELQSFDGHGYSMLAASMPSSLRMLSWRLPESGAVQWDRLPPQSTVLGLLDLKEAVLPLGKLTNSLVTLSLRYDSDVLRWQTEPKYRP